MNLYLLEHAYGWLRGRPLHERLWDPAIFYPAENVLAYSDLMLSFEPFYGMWRLAGAEPEQAMLCWLLSVCVLNYVVAYVFLRRVVEASTLGSASGAFLLSFAASRIQQIVHPQLLPAFYVVGAVAAVWLYFRRLARQEEPSRTWRRRLWIVVFFTCLTAQFYGAFYMAYFLLLGLFFALVFAFLWSTSRRMVVETVRRDAWLLFLCTTMSGLVLYPVISHYLLLAGTVGYRSWTEVQPFLPRLQSWLFVGEDSYFYGWMANLPLWANLPKAHEQAMGVGPLTSFLVLAGYYQKRCRLFALILAGTTLALILVTVSIGGHSAWQVAWAWLPGASALRAISRLGLILLVPAAIGLALALSALTERGRYGLALSFLVISCAEQARQLTTYHWQNNRHYVDAIEEKIDKSMDAFVISARDPKLHRTLLQLDAMFASLQSGVPTINGYSGNAPPAWYESFWDSDTTTPHQRERFQRSLDAWAARHDLDREKIQWIEMDPYRR